MADETTEGVAQRTPAQLGEAGTATEEPGAAIQVDVPSGETGARIIAALLGSAATLVPIPLLDDFLRERIMQYQVSRTLKLHGRTYGSAAVKPLWADGGGCLSGCVGALIKVPLAILLFPIRTFWKIFTAARSLMSDLSRSLLFGRTLDRLLSQNRLMGDEEQLQVEAAQVRAAFDHAIKGFDTSLLSSYLKDGLSTVSGLGKVAVKNARKLFRRAEPEGEITDQIDAKDRQILQEGSEKVQGVLNDPKIVALLEEFDQRFDAAL